MSRKLTTSSCTICGTLRYISYSRGMSFHNIPIGHSYRATTEEGLHFMGLKKSSEWGNEEWKTISLCLLHFAEPFHSTLKTIYPPGTVPTKCNEDVLMESTQLSPEVAISNIYNNYLLVFCHWFAFISSLTQRFIID